MIIENDLANNLVIYQDNNQNNYTQDSLLLVDFININKKCNKILELCAGNGPISMLLTNKTDISISSVELQEKNVELFTKSIKHNKIDNQITIYHDNVIDINQKIGANCWDLIVCNPPYYKVDTDTKIHKKDALGIARHELELTFEQLVKEVKTLLSNKGKFVFIHVAIRFDELIKTLHEYNFHISRIQFIYTNNKEASRVLVECVKHDSVHTKILPPTTI